MKTVNCIFCCQNKKKAKEHIWPRWLQLCVMGNTKFNYSGTHLTFFKDRILSQRTQSGEKLVFGNVCVDCNNGWMSDLEECFKPIFMEIHKNYDKIECLSKNDRQKIILWCFKTALMINAGTNYRQIIPIHHYSSFFKTKQIPKDVKIDITYLFSDSTLKWEQGNITFVIFDKSGNCSPIPNQEIRNSYVISMQIGNLGIKISYFKNCKELGYSISQAKENKALRIWPYLQNGHFKVNNNYHELSDFDLDTYLVCEK